MRKYRRHLYEGITLRSGLELEVAKLLTREGVAWTYETLRFSYWVKTPRSYCRDCDSTHVFTKHSYTPDFHLTASDRIIEVKGLFSSKDRKKHAALKEQYPNLEIYMWFSQDKKLFPMRSKDRYSDWCKEHDIPYHVGLKEIPEWLTT